MDPKITDAIQQSVRDEGQSDALARRLIAWFKAVASGNEDINDRQSANRHLELLYGEVQLPGGHVDDIDDNVEESYSSTDPPEEAG